MFPMTELSIALSFHQDGSREYSTGYWVATAGTDNSPEYDAVGLTPVDAAMALARVLYEESGESDKRQRIVSEAAKLVIWWRSMGVDGPLQTHPMAPLARAVDAFMTAEDAG
jgi:hypothetical protein